MYTWHDYDPGEFFDELFSSPGNPRLPARRLVAHFRKLTAGQMAARRRAAEIAILEMGVSFTVYSEGDNIDRAWPFDILPRVIARKEWDRLAAGLIQRCTALNRFIEDLYNDQHVLRDRIVPRELIEGSANFRRECRGVRPPHGIWAHITGSDLVRDNDGTFYVLEDNLRIPSGVSYMIENREVSKRVLPELFRRHSILPVDDYPRQLFETLASLSPRPLEFPEVVVLTPGIYNSAYFEHSFLAQGMGAELVEGEDLFVDDDDTVFMCTVDGPKQVDVIYRRVDDEFLDPEVFNPDSALGVPGLMRAWRAGKVAIANAPGGGVADDKAVYAYVPALIRYYLDEEPIIPNVPTYLCGDEQQRQHVLANLAQMVVKPVDASGGYGMLVGPYASQRQREEFARLIKARPRDYIAQPTLALSTAPTLVATGVAPRHLDLRPFVLQGADSYVTSGGLTRVALNEGSLVVNSSQGGGSKDTWVVET